MKEYCHRLWLTALVVLIFLPCISAPQTKPLAPPRVSVPRSSGDHLDECCFHEVFSNEQVRVLRLQMSPHQSTGVNRRSHDYLILPLQYAYMKTVGDANSFDFELRIGQMQVIKGGWPHRTINAADSALDVLEFEVTRGIHPEKAICGIGGKNCSDGTFGKEGGTYEAATIFETPTVRLRKIELGPGGTLAEHQHAGGEILLAVTAVQLANETGPGRSAPLHLDRGQVQWFTAGLEHSLHNESKQTAQFYELELK
jgi:quercetin dioxygenase-like cupin family protein